jgi:hypothetical protein
MKRTLPIVSFLPPWCLAAPAASAATITLTGAITQSRGIRKPERWLNYVLVASVTLSQPSPLSASFVVTLVFGRDRSALERYDTKGKSR